MASSPAHCFGARAQATNRNESKTPNRSDLTGALLSPWSNTYSRRTSGQHGLHSLHKTNPSPSRGLRAFSSQAHVSTLSRVTQRARLRGQLSHLMSNLNTDPTSRNVQLTSAVLKSVVSTYHKVLGSVQVTGRHHNPRPIPGAAKGQTGQTD